MNWWQQIDIYCERTDFSFWSEPINALTNLGFVIAGVLVLTRHHGGSQRKILGALMILIGLCSFWFHTMASRISALADALSILLFATVFLGFHVRAVFKKSVMVSTLIALGFAVASFFFPQLWAVASGPKLNGGEAYFPYVITLIFLGWSLHNQADARWKIFAKATTLLMIALVFRTIDQPMCEMFPLGTHFLWHLTNSFLLYVVASSFENQQVRLQSSV